MTVTSKEVIDAFVDGVMARISTAVTAGMFAGATVTEGDEMPGYFDPPAIFVIPLMEGKDQISTSLSMSEIPSGVHKFPITVVGYWKYTGSTGRSDGLRPVRGYGYDLIDLFTGGVAETLEVFVTQIVEGEGEEEDETFTYQYIGHNYSPTLEVGYFMVSDYVIHYAIVRLNIVIGM